jgi:2-methylisocitrate lyase-like PEP mutase family enzyme
MSDTKVLIEELDSKVSLLISKLEEVKKGALIKDQLIAKMEGDLKMKDERIADLEEEVELLKAVKPDAEQENLKIKISEMVKEIDNCISLLKV